MNVQSIFVQPNHGEIPFSSDPNKISNNNDYEWPSFFTDEDEINEEEEEDSSPDITQIAENFDELKIKRSVMLSELNDEKCENEDLPMEFDNNKEFKNEICEEFIEELNEDDNEELTAEVNEELNEKNDNEELNEKEHNEEFNEKEDLEEKKETILPVPIIYQKIRSSSDFPNNQSKNEPLSPSRLLIRKSNSLPSASGMIKKKSPHIVQGWQERFCIVKAKKILYFHPKNKEKLLGCIDFDLVSVKIEEIKDNQFKILAYGSDKVFWFKTKEKQERDNWVTILKQNINSSYGATKLLTVTSKLPKFWKVDRISESQFLLKADTCDILLFRTKNMGAKFQRSITRSHYDHVALLLRYNDGEIVLLEATGKEGVGLCRWKTFMQNNWHLLYSKLVYRHLEIDRVEGFIKEVEKFVKNVLGKKYKISASKLLKKKSVVANYREPDQKTTFFCSELVAACYKKLKLLPKEISCSTYWPGSFSSEKKLSFIGTRLGPEQLIDFNL